MRRLPILSALAFVVACGSGDGNGDAGATAGGGAGGAGTAASGGGAAVTGGSSGKGGTLAKGGTSSKGGSPAGGGATSKGGASALGGGTAQGGASAMGGSSTTGGASGKGGTGTGGVGAQGGAVGPGGSGASGKGGTPAAGGAAGTGQGGAGQGGVAGTSAGGASGAPGGEWLSVVGNQILAPGGTPFHGRGANLHDMRSCNACTFLDPDVPGLNRWSDELIDNWHANFIRFDLEAYADDAGYRKQWKTITDDPLYATDVLAAVTHMTSKPGVYVLVTLFMDPAISDNTGAYDSEWPTDAAGPNYQKIVDLFHDQPRVLFGLTNEPHGPVANDPELAMRYQKAIATIRAQEKLHNASEHVIVVQAPQGYARDLTYFVQNPLPGTNIAYEIHPYNQEKDFDALIVQPKKTLPVLIGEYGPADLGGGAAMTDADIKAMWAVAQANEVPHIAWNFHQRCPPNMLQDTASDGCGLAAASGYAFPKTAWGVLFHDYMQTPW